MPSGGPRPIDIPHRKTSNNAKGRPKKILVHSESGFDTSASSYNSDHDSQGVDATLLGGAEIPDDTEATEKIHSFTLTERIRKHIIGFNGNAKDRQKAAIFVSHGESVEEAFPAWLRLAYLGGGSGYRPYDLNMPLTIPKRPHLHYEGDSPLTEHGKVTAEMIGHGLRSEKLHPVRIFCGPELRCVQTATAIARSLRSSASIICVDASLMEWTQMRDASEYFFLTPKQYRCLGYPIDIGYEPSTTVKKLAEKGESTSEYHERLTTFITQSMKQSKESSILFVSSPHLIHAARDECWIKPSELQSIRATVEPCTTHMIEVTKNNEIRMNSSPIRHLTCTLYDSLKFSSDE